MGSTILCAITSVFSALDDWDYRREQILIGSFIHWEWISLGTDARVFCCSTILSLQFKLLETLSGTWIRMYYFTLFSKVLFCSMISSFIVLLFSPLQVLLFDFIFLLITVITDCFKKLNSSEAPSFFQYFIKTFPN